MKTYKNLWEKFIEEDNFRLAYKNAIKKKSRQKQIRCFQKDEENNLSALRNMVANGEFCTSQYKEKKIYEPKERIIYKLPFAPDRIVQHAIMNILKPILTNLLIENTCACIEGRGPLKASIKCSEYVRKYKYCLKCDISKFYPSINQRILSEKFHRIIKDVRFMEILDDVIYSFPGGRNCPIGNYCSQWFGNYYLSFLDNYILHSLKCGAYERYCDDFMLFSNDKKFLGQCKKDIGIYLNSELGLEYSKADIFSTKQGVDFVGYRHFKKYVLIRKSTSKRIKRRMRNIEGSIDNAEDIKRIEGQLASAHGILKHACSNHFRKSIHLDEMQNRIKALKKGEFNASKIQDNIIRPNRGRHKAD